MLLPAIFFCALVTMGRCVDDPVCCTPDQWEASMFWDNGNCFIDAGLKTKGPSVGTAFSYINGTLKTAYDFTNGRTYIKASIVEISPLIPRPISEDTTFIRDYKHGIEYQFGATDCQKTKLEPLKRHCVPGGAVHLGEGTLGKDNSTRVSTYAYTLTLDNPYPFQSTVTQKGCLPVHVMYVMGSSEADSGAVNSLEVSDVTPGIKDPTIFDIPPQCKSGEIGIKMSPGWLRPFL